MNYRPDIVSTPKVEFFIDQAFIKVMYEVSEEARTPIVSAVQKAFGEACWSSAFQSPEEGEAWKVAITPSADGYEPEDELNVHGFFITSTGPDGVTAFFYLDEEGEAQIYI